MNKLLKTLEYDKVINLLSKHAATSLGRELCEHLAPSYCLPEIDFLLKETVAAVSITIQLGAPPFSGIHDIRGTVKRAELSSILSPEEILNVADTLRGSKLLKKHINELESPSVLSEYFNNLYTNSSVEETIYKCIDSPDHIADHASKELFHIRSQIRQSESVIKEKINSILHGGSYSKYLQENIVTIRNGRYVVPVKQEHRSAVPGLVHDSSSTGSTLFVEPIAMVEANNKIRELYIEEKIEIEKILITLSELIREISKELSSSLELISKLDFCFAKANYAIELNAFAPTLNEYGYVNLKRARHPLIDKHSVVPIDISLGNDYTTLVITGPNTGGKTVTLKTLGLLTLMTYSGLLIPCLESSEIAVFDSIFADIGDEQSIEQSLSTFSAHMTNIIRIVNNSSSNSFVLLDELGSGTDPVEGSALAMAILEHLYNKGCRVVASTHYSELKTYALCTSGIKNASCEFDVETLSPTYKLIIGLPGKSNAFAISEKLGLNSSIISAAQNFVSTEKAEFEDIIASLQKDRQIINAEREEAERNLKEALTLKNDLEISKQKIEEYKSKAIAKAKEEATEILLSAEETARESIREITSAQNLKYHEMTESFDATKNKIRRQLKKTYRSVSEVQDNYTPFEIKIGMSVYVPDLDREATVLTLPDKDNNLFIQAGIIKTKIDIKRLRPSTKEKETINNVKISVNIENAAKQISPEISLRGMSSDEALYELDKYINSALLANLPSIRIVHGKGEWILKKVVHEYLKNHPNVKSFRLGVFGEGDLGVTIAELQ